MTERRRDRTARFKDPNAAASPRTPPTRRHRTAHMNHRFLSTKNDLDIERAITAMIVCPTLEDAVEVLKQQGSNTCVGTLQWWRDGNPATRERYEQRRQELAPQLEGIFANDLLDNARRGTLAIRLAIEKTQRLLEAGQVQDPSRVARDLSQVVTQSVDKRLALQGRPTQIVETRDVGESSGPYEPWAYWSRTRRSRTPASPVSTRIGC